MRIYRAELHVHTVLSPCAEVEMIPPLIVSEALARGIEIIAITDHNACANVTAVQKAASGTGLTVLPGMELQTREEVHLLCLFGDLETVEVWQKRVDGWMPGIANRPEYFGEQFVVDYTGEFIRREEQLLLTSADIKLETAIRQVHELGGLAIPAHVDRRQFGLIGQLGLVPPGLAVLACEISRHLDIQTAQARYPSLNPYPLLRGGDAHRLNELLGDNLFYLESPTLAEIRLAFRKQKNRSFYLESA